MNTVPELQFGVSNISDRIWAGILGLGYGYPWNTDYLTVLDNIWLYGFVDSPIFSIGIGGVGDGFSEIVFGGVNVFKFAGPLEPLPLDPPPGEQKRGWVHYWINVTSIGVTRPGERPIMFTNPEHFNMRVLIDTGSTLSWVWPEVARIIAEQFNATYDEQHKTYYVDCAYKDLSGTVDWGFNRGNLVVQVRYKDFIHEPAPGYCKLGVQPTEGPLYILGDTFIRGAYRKSDVSRYNFLGKVDSGD